MTVLATVYAEMTPNPTTMKFVANKYLLATYFLLCNLCLKLPIKQPARYFIYNDLTPNKPSWYHIILIR